MYNWEFWEFPPGSGQVLNKFCRKEHTCVYPEVYNGNKQKPLVPFTVLICIHSRWKWNFDIWHQIRIDAFSWRAILLLLCRSQLGNATNGASFDNRGISEVCGSGESRFQNHCLWFFFGNRTYMVSEWLWVLQLTHKKKTVAKDEPSFWACLCIQSVHVCVCVHNPWQAHMCMQRFFSYAHIVRSLPNFSQRLAQ